MEHVIARDTWKKLVAALIDPEPNPVTGVVTETEIIWLLAEVGGIVPAEIGTEDLQIS